MATRIETGVEVDELALELEPDRKDSREADDGIPEHEWADGDEFPIIEGFRPNIVTEFRGKMRTRGAYPAGHPEGIVVHHLAGRDGARRAMRVAVERNKFKYDTIGGDGTVCLAGDNGRYGFHTGESFHPKLGHGVARRLHGVELTSAGLLTRHENRCYFWWDKGRKNPLAEHEQRFAEKGQWSNVTTTGWYHCFTPAQERSLTWLLFYYRILFGADFRYCLGHEEVAVRYEKKGGKPSPDSVTPDNFRSLLGRKNDPGGSLSMSMDDLRTRVGLERGW